MNGPNPISWEAIDAFQRNSGVHLNPWDVEVIEMLDNVYIWKVAKQQASQRDKQQAIKDGAGSVGKGFKRVAKEG